MSDALPVPRVTPRAQPMRWSWRIATVAGIPIYVHGTFLILIAFLLFDGVADDGDVAAAVSSVLFVLAIFATIVLHELGHALTAKRFGVRTRDITLLPIGGIARLERMPDVPRQELWVALAGPAVNVVLAAICAAGFLAAGRGMPSLSLDLETGVVERFLTVNIFLAVFNMVPAFPMDGGRALRALLAERMDYVRATEIAANIGQGLALVFGLVGLLGNPILIFIALFVWMGASAEASMATVRDALAGIPVSRAMITDFRAVEAGQSLQQVIEMVLKGSQRDFPVVDDEGTLVGVLTQERLLAALHERGPLSRVGDAMETAFESADVREMLEGAFLRLQSGRHGVMPVVREGRLVGLLTPENIAEYLMIRGALRR